jgi:hypothetical protein
MWVLNQAGQELEAARSPTGKSSQCHNASQIATRAGRLSIAPRRPLPLARDTFRHPDFGGPFPQRPPGGPLKLFDLMSAIAYLYRLHKNQPFLRYTLHKETILYEQQNSYQRR